MGRQCFERATLVTSRDEPRGRRNIGVNLIHNVTTLMEDKIYRTDHSDKNSIALLGVLQKISQLRMVKPEIHQVNIRHLTQLGYTREARGPMSLAKEQTSMVHV